MSKTSLNIILLKKGISESDAMRWKKDDKDKPKEEKFGDKTLFYKKTLPSAPKWKDFFKDNLSDEITRGGSISALYFVTLDMPVELDTDVKSMEKRTFAIVFGNGRHFLKSESIELKFGMYTVLGAIEAESIKLVDINSIESIPRSTKTQASKNVGIDFLGFDTTRDILTGVKGIAKERHQGLLGKVLKGADTLQLSTEKAFDEIDDILKLAFTIYNNKEYKDSFEFIANLSFIKDKKLQENLRNELFRLVREDEGKNIWLGIPEIVDSDVIGFTLRNSDALYDDLDLDEIIEELKIAKKELSYEKIKNVKIYPYTGSDEFRSPWKLFDCFFAEIVFNGSTYILNSGKWYEANKEFVKKVETYYQNIKLSDFPFIDYDDGVLKDVDDKLNSENAYNRVLQKYDEKSRVLCDAQNIPYGEGGSKIEVCDILAKRRNEEEKNQLIHIKISSTSSTLSHLFNQGFVSARLLKGDEEFVGDVNEAFFKDSEWKLREGGIDSSQYEIIFGIIQKRNKKDKRTGIFRPSIPLFSKISIKRVVEDLKTYGYKVSIAGIPDLTTKERRKEIKANLEKKKKEKKEE